MGNVSSFAPTNESSDCWSAANSYNFNIRAKSMQQIKSNLIGWEERKSCPFLVFFLWVGVRSKVHSPSCYRMALNKLQMLLNGVWMDKQGTSHSTEYHINIILNIMYFLYTCINWPRIFSYQSVSVYYGTQAQQPTRA